MRRSSEGVATEVCNMGRLPKHWGSCGGVVVEGWGYVRRTPVHDKSQGLSPTKVTCQSRTISCTPQAVCLHETTRSWFAQVRS